MSEKPHFYVAPGVKAKKDAPCWRCGGKWDDPIHIKPKPLRTAV